MDDPERYRAITQHWAHAEQIRWVQLNNYLVASSILVLAWATIYVVPAPSLRAVIGKTIVLLLLSVAGLRLSIVMGRLAARGNAFVDAYMRLALDNEGGDQGWPFTHAEMLRATLAGNAALGPTREVMITIPTMFRRLYLALTVLAALLLLPP